MILAAESGLEAAQANASLAESTHKRFQELLTRKSVSQQEFDEVQARYRAASAEVRRAEEMLRSLEARKLQVQARIDQARAQLASAELHKGYSRVTSPMSGLVTSKQVEVGQLASPGSVLFTIEDDKNYRLEATVEESRIRYISQGDGMAVHIDALGVDLEGSVAEIVPTSDPGSRSFTVKIELPSNSMLRSGLFGRARFSGGTRMTLTLPSDSILQRGQLSGVYLVNSDQTVRFQLVKTGRQINQRIEILSGLDQGDRVVVEAIDRLEEGDPVKIVNTNTLLDPVGSFVKVEEGESA
jgi:RND family efflux transporter MFP subunit